ncbi:B12-binding domain-containing radical SAM protein [Anaerofustis stercorihominis]|uniref:Radical SAM domain protein n=1 Tax=Anaerofustis stercorihominis DSM 17244 TaxID=445971 RepID=B1C662_9FIRM|nr:B12-binding domain-containing radical SAM protein [Anaerofustis stercorihominis]EDS73347.1 radical SAM domain protein [Anaerofustis stercorihominis DSM 17244]MCQ4794799.1 B12-binding domain-containing radical SAM protein [Anaerofustis stercorihominis]
MKVTLVGINSAYSHTNLAVYYLLNNSIPKGVDAGVKQYNINMLEENVIEDLFYEKSDVYIFSSYIWNIEYVLKVASSLKKTTNAKIVLGGSEVSFNAKNYFDRYDFIDYILAGEGEEITYDLLNGINNNKKISIVNVFDKNSKDYNYIKKHIDFNKVIFPYKNVNMEDFQNKIIYYESQRGCPYNCSYCLSELDKSLRFRDLNKVKEEIMFFIDNNIPLVKFIDRTFNADNKRAKEIIRFILRNSKHTKFHFEVCANLLDDEIIELLGSAPNDMFQLEIGLQSINEHTIKEINRTTDTEKIGINVLKLLKNDNVHIHLDLISGLPYEDLNSFKESFNFAYNLKPHMLQLGFLKILHGTMIEKKKKDYDLKYNDFTPYEILSNKWLSYEDISNLKNIEFLIDRYFNSNNFYNTLEFFVNRIADSPFEFYEMLKDYFIKNELFKRSISKDDLYEILYDFFKAYDEKTAYNLLSFDYLSYVKIRKPKKEFIEKIEVLNKEEVFEMLKTEDFRELYLNEYNELSNKEVYKKISLYKFTINPITKEKKETLILFKNKKQDKVRLGHEYFCLS